MDILIAEDDNTSRLILENHLAKWGHRVIATANGRQAWEVLQGAGPPPIALLDWLMPEMDGMDVCRMLREHRREHFTYIIMLTARGAKEDIVAALEAGADDYVVKPCDIEELHARVDVGIRIVTLHDELVATNKKLARLASTDFLTQLRNRRGIMESLEAELARAQREQKPLSVVMLDLDTFKEVNDTCGHLAGDQVLIEVARRLRGHCRPYDIVGRYGGDEFMVLVPSSPYDEISALAERFRDAISSASIEADGHVLETATSVGAVWLEQSMGTGVDELVRASDTLLYRAKQAGGNRAVCALFAQVKQMSSSSAGAISEAKR